MKRLGAAAAVVLGWAGPAPAQVLWGPVGVANYGYQSGVSVGFGGPRFGFAAGFSRSFVSTTQVYGPVVARPWGWGPPGWGSPYWGPPVWGPPAVVAVPVVVPAVAFAPPVRQQPDDPPEVEVPAVVKPPVNRADFVVVRPGGRPLNPPPAVRPKPVEKPFAFVPNPAPGGFPVAIAPPADPKARAGTEIATARAAFAAGQYGRAVERLAAAAKSDPESPLPHFLTAQARTARGEYAEAVAAIRDGLRLAPDWPTSGFRPRELYGPAAAPFDAHFADLRAALAARPDDPTLQFLVGYHLWFLGDRDEAAKLFRKAAAAVKDSGPADRFLTEYEGKKA